MVRNATRFPPRLSRSITPLGGGETDSGFLKIALSCCHEKAPRRDAPLFHDCLPLIGLGESDSAPTASGRRSARRKLTAGSTRIRRVGHASGQINACFDWAELSPARLVRGSSMPCSSSRCTPYARHCYRTSRPGTFHHRDSFGGLTLAEHWRPKS
jgi:hypothetical protein